MSGPAARIRSAAVLAERAAAAHQYAGLAGARPDPATIGALQLASDSLSYAADRLEPPPRTSGRTQVEALLMTGVWVVSLVAVLLAVPDSSRPWVLTLALVGAGLLSTLLGRVVTAVWDRQAIRALASTKPLEVQHTIAELRIRVSEVAATLQPDRDDAHLEVGRRIESALVWVDAAERRVERLERDANRG
jgi:hypothetical protein